MMKRSTSNKGGYGASPVATQVLDMERHLARVSRRSTELFTEVKELRTLNRVQGTTIANLRSVARASDKSFTALLDSRRVISQDFDEVKLWWGWTFLYAVLVSVGLALCL